jgi:virulence-associated protein VapD
MIVCLQHGQVKTVRVVADDIGGSLKFWEEVGELFFGEAVVDTIGIVIRYHNRDAELGWISKLAEGVFGFNINDDWF